MFYINNESLILFSKKYSYVCAWWILCVTYHSAWCKNVAYWNHYHSCDSCKHKLLHNLIFFKLLLIDVTYLFVDSLSNPIIIVTICVPKRWEKWLCADNQVFIRFVPKVNGVECEETLWKYSPKSWGMHAWKKVPSRMLLPKGTFLI